MKLHLPVKLRANLIAAVIAVTAGVYNAYAYNYTETQQNLVGVYQQTAGNTYTAMTDPISGTPGAITIATETPTQGRLVSYIEGDTAMRTDGDLTIKNSLELGATNNADIHGKTTLEAGRLVINRDNALSQASSVVLVDADVTAGETSVASASSLIISDGKQPLSDKEKAALIVEGVDLHQDLEDVSGEPHTVSLGEVTNDGSVSVLGDKERTFVEGGEAEMVVKSGAWMENEELDGRVSVALDSVSGNGVLGIGNADAEVEEDVLQTDLNLINSRVAVGGSVVTKGLEVNKESSLTVQGDISANPADSGVSIGGKVVSVTGDIELQNGVLERGNGLQELSHLEATAGDITLENVGGEKMEELKAGQDLTLNNESEILDSGKISAGGDMTVDQHSSLQRSTVQHVGGDLRVDHGSDVTDSFIEQVGGDITVAERAVVDISEASGASDNFINGEDGAKKGNLAAILQQAGDTSSAPVLTKEQVEATGKTVGSVIGGGASSNINVQAGTIESTLITGGGDVALTEGAAVDGVIIDVRGNLPHPDGSGDFNDLTVEDSSLDNSIVLGVTGKIKIDGSDLNNNYIDGGSGLEIDDSTIIDTDFVNLTADIKISGTETRIAGSEEGGKFVIATKGTADFADQDEVTGGSIILENTSLENGIIASGVTASYGEDGRLSLTPIAETDTPVQVVGGSGLVDKGDGSLLPYGNISAKGATLTDMEISTAKGDISLASSLVTSALPAYRTEGADSNQNANIASFTATKDSLGGGVLKEISIAGRTNVRGGDTSPVRLVVGVMQDGSFVEVGRSANQISMTANADVAAAMHTFAFDREVVLADGTEYTFKFLKEDGSWASVGVRLNRTDRLGLEEERTMPGLVINGSHYSLVSDKIVTRHVSEILRSDILSSKGNVSISEGSRVTASTIAKDRDGAAIEGSLDMDDSVVASAGEDEDYRKSVIAVTGDGTVDGSAVSGANLAVGGDLTVASSSVVTGDTHVRVGGTMTVTGASELSLNGDAHAADAHDASVTADKLALGTLKDNAASVTKGQVAIASETSTQEGNTLTLTQVNGSKEEAGEFATLGDLVQETKDGDVTNTKLVVNGESLVQMDRVASRAGLSGDKTAVSDYFDMLTVDQNSTVVATDTAAISRVEVGKAGAGVWDASADTVGSKLRFEKDAWLTDLDIRGRGGDTYRGADGGVETIVKGAAHIGNLTFGQEGALSLVASVEAPTDTVSYIANIEKGSFGELHGVLNVVGEELKTPVLNGRNYLTLGLNGGVVTLEQVSAENGATVASRAQVNPHVSVKQITNASLTGAPDVTPVGQSTIRTTLNRITTPYSASMGDAVEATGHTLYYVARTDGTLSDGTTVTAGQLVTRDDLAPVATDFGGAMGEVTTGVAPVDAAHLTENDALILDRIDVPVLDENGQLQYSEDGTVLTTGQKSTPLTIVTYPNAQQTMGVVEEKTDGIASLTVKENMDSDNTLIRAYETGSVDALTGETTPDANTGFIRIDGHLTGQDNVLEADNNVTIGGIVAYGGSLVNNNNSVTSNRGNIAVGQGGIVGSGNKLTASVGSIAVNGATNGNENTLTAGTTITTQDINGNSNELEAEESIETQTITGYANTLTAGTTITTQDINGNQNKLKAGESITTQTITGNANTLTAGTTITTQNINGNSNELEAEESIETQTITGYANTLTAGTTITTQDINGNSNELEAGESITTQTITGNANTLTAGTTITTQDINGNSNELEAEESIETQTITGYANTLTAGTTITTQDINGNSNELKAGESIETGSITGNANALTSGSSTTVNGSLNGHQNTIEAGTDATVTGDVTGNGNRIAAKDGLLRVGGTVSGAGNELSSEKGAIQLGGLVGTEANRPNKVTASTTVTVGSLSGIGSDVLAYANGLSQDDVAIHVADFSAQGSALRIATVSDPVYGQTNGNGAIVIDALGAVQGDVDASLLNSIVSNNSYVQLGSLQGFNARTEITAAKDIIVTEGLVAAAEGDASPVQQTASSQTWRAKNLLMADGVDLTLTDSRVIVTGSITGTSLTLTTSDNVATPYVSSADNVTLGSLTLGGYATLAANSAVIDTLTISGAFASLDATASHVKTLVLQNGADYIGSRVIADNLVINNSSLTTATLANVKSLSLQNGSNVLISGAAGKTDLTGEVKLEGGSTLRVLAGLKTTADITAASSDILAEGNVTGQDITLSDNSKLTGSNITANGAFSATNSTVNAKGTLTVAGALNVAGTEIDANKIAASSLTADLGSDLATTRGIALGGALQVQNGSVVTAGTGITGATNVDVLTGATVNGSIGMNGVLTVNDGTVNGATSGATSTTVTNGSTGDVALANNGTVTAISATMGHITGAGTVSLTDAQVGDIVDMDGALSATDATTGAITGTVSSAVLTNANIGSGLTTVGTALVQGGSVINGSLTAGDQATVKQSTVNGGVQGSVVEATSSSIGGDVKATNGGATVSGGSVEGSVTATELAKVEDATIKQNVQGATAEVTNGTIGGSVTATTGAATLVGGTVGNGVTAQTNALLNGVEVTGSVVATSGNATVTGGSVKGSVNAGQLAQVQDATVTQNVQGATATVTNGTIGGDVKATNGGATVTGGSVEGSVTATELAKVEDATVTQNVQGATATVTNGTIGGSVTATSGDATVTGGSVKGSVSATQGVASITDAQVGDVTAQSATIVDSSTGSITTTQDLQTVGQVNASGNVSVGGALKVSEGVLNAGSNAVTVAGKTTLENGSVEAGAFTTAGMELVGVTGDVKTLDSTGSAILLNGSHLNVLGEEGDVVKGSLLTVKGNGSLSAAGAAKITGRVRVTEESSLTGTKLDAQGLTVDDSLVSMTEGIALNANSLEVSHNGVLTGNVSGATTAEITGGSRLDGSLAMNGELTVSDSSVTGSVTGATSAMVTNGSTGNIAMAANGSLDASDATLGNVTGAGDVELEGTQVGTVSMSGALTADHATTGAITGTGANGTIASASVTNGSVIGSGLTAAGSVSVDSSVVKGAVSGSEATVANGSTIEGGVTATTGDALISGSSVGDVTAANGTASLTEGAVAGAVNAQNVLAQDAEAASIAATDTASLTDTTVAGDVTGDNGVTLTDSSIGGAVSSANGSVASTGSTIAGDVEAAQDATITGGLAGNVTATTGDALISGSSVGDVTAANGTASLTEGAVAGAVNAQNVTAQDAEAASIAATDTASLTDTTVAGDVSGDNGVTLTDSSIGGAVSSANGSVASTGSTIAGNVEAAQDATITGGLAGNVTAMNGDATITEGATVGSVTAANGTASLTEGAVAGVVNAQNVLAQDAEADSIAATDTASLTDTTVTGSVSGDNGVTLAGSSVGGTVSSANGSVASTGSTIAGDVEAAQDAMITGGLAGNVTATNGNATITEGATVGAVTAANGTASLTEGAVAGAVNAQNVTAQDAEAASIVATDTAMLTDVMVAGLLKVDEALTVAEVVKTGAVETGDLSVKPKSTLLAVADVAADGVLDIRGQVVSKEGNVSLTGAAGSMVTGAVTAAREVALGGVMKVADTTVKGAEARLADGAVIATENATLEAGTIAVQGTLNAGKGTMLAGTVAGNGTINKTGADALVVSDGSRIGSLNVRDGSTLQIAGDEIGALRAQTATFAQDTTLDVTTDLQKYDRLEAAKVAGNGATLKLNNVGTLNEAAVADQTRLHVLGGDASGFNEDVVHNLDTLNAHMEGGDVVLSKNYKGVEKTENQSQVAHALSSIHPEAVQGTEMGAALDALNHTRSAQAALDALDSLSGRGLAGAQKLVEDESHEHIQTLRSTLKSASSGIARRFDSVGRVIPGVNSNAITASATVGHSDVSDNGNSGKYTRNSWGAMVAGAHAINANWTFGADIAFSSSDAQCSETSLEANAVFVDVALLYKSPSGRFTQTGTLGAAFFDIDTERYVNIDAAGHSFSGRGEGSTNATAVNFSYEAAYDWVVSEDKAHVLTSVVQADATFASFDDLRESGMGNVGLDAQFDDVASLTFGAGARYTYNFSTAGKPGYFSAEALFVANAGDSMPKVNNRFIAGGTGFVTEGPDAGNVGLRLNAGALVPVSEDWALFGNVTSEFRNYETMVGGAVGVKYSF